MDFPSPPILHSHGKLDDVDEFKVDPDMRCLVLLVKTGSKVRGGRGLRADSVAALELNQIVDTVLAGTESADRAARLHDGLTFGLGLRRPGDRPLLPPGPERDSHHLQVR